MTAEPTFLICSNSEHVRHDYDALNEVVLQQQKVIEQLSLHMQRLQSKLEANSDPEIRDAETKLPPHY